MHFRNLSKKDYLDDQASRLTIEQLKNVKFRATFFKVFLVIFLAFFIVVPSDIWLNYFPVTLLQKILIFLVVFLICALIVRHFKKDIRGEWVQLHGALYVRVVYFTIPIFLLRILYPAPGGVYFLGVIVAGGIIGRIIQWRQEKNNPGWVAAAKPHEEMERLTLLSRSLNWTKRLVMRGLRFLLDIALAAWLQIALFLTALRSVFLFAAYFVVTVCAIVSLIWKKDEPDAVPCTSVGSGKRFTLAHLSDLHFMSADVSIGLEGPNRNRQTTEFLENNAAILASVDVIAVTGDITDTGFHDEWIEADRAFEKIVDIADKKDVKPKFAFIPGNHDINIFASYDKSVRESTYEKALTTFGLGKYSSREIRLIRYLAFWTKWCGETSSVFKNGKAITMDAYLQPVTGRLNHFADERDQKTVKANEVRAAFDGLFPASMKVADAAVIYSLDSNAQTWHIVANSYGMIGLCQLVRLWRMLSEHPPGHAAIFLLHHHIRPGTKKKNFKDTKPWKKIEEFAMITVDAFIFRLILRWQMKQKALVLHGHTHFERYYTVGKHSVICAPSSGYGEGSFPVPQNIARVYDLSVDGEGNLSINNVSTLSQNDKVSPPVPRIVYVTVILLACLTSAWRFLSRSKLNG